MDTNNDALWIIQTGIFCSHGKKGPKIMLCKRDRYLLSNMGTILSIHGSIHEAEVPTDPHIVIVHSNIPWRIHGTFCRFYYYMKTIHIFKQTYMDPMSIKASHFFQETCDRKCWLVIWLLIVVEVPYHSSLITCRFSLFRPPTQVIDIHPSLHQGVIPQPQDAGFSKALGFFL